MITTLCFTFVSIYTKCQCFKDTGALLVYYVLHVASPRVNEAKYFIISHVACKYTCIKTHQL